MYALTHTVLCRTLHSSLLTQQHLSVYTTHGRPPTPMYEYSFQGRGIDLTHKDFLILQGKVKSTVQMKS